MARGKHASKAGQSAFTRDAAIMAVGILIVAALVYGLLWLVQSIRNSDGPVASETTLVADTTTAPSTSTSTTAAPTTTVVITTTTAPVIEVRPPGDVTVIVLNSIGTTGLAATVTAQLDELGYDMLEPDNFQPQQEQSKIWYKPGFGPDANDLAANFTDVIVELNPDVLPEADIIVLLGVSYEGG